MKYAVLTLLTLSMLVSGGCGDKKETITISGAWALYPLTVKWVQEYQKLHPNVTIEVSAGGAGKGMADALSEVVDIGMVSREVYQAEIEKGAFWVSVSRDAVVPTANADNPLKSEILKRGIGKDAFRSIWIAEQTGTWQAALRLEAETQTAISVYTRSDACGAAETWAAFMGGHQEDLQGTGVFGDPGVADAVRKDVVGIGYNNINFAYDPSTKKPAGGLFVIPIDLNDDGRISEDEDFYTTRDEVVEAIAAGVYPSPPSRDLYFLTHGVPQRQVVKDFINWVLTDGQNYVDGAGYIKLQDKTLAAQVRKLETK